ncbi:MAG: DNA-formamidopyrimidine glycosylase family protein [Myxococcota bacterium]
MPEIPDITVYVEQLEPRVVGSKLLDLKFISPFVLRTVTPPKEEFIGKTVQSVHRLHKRIIFSLEGERFLAVHLMRAGRFRWLEGDKEKKPDRLTLAAMRFEKGTLVLTEAGTKKRASVHLMQGKAALKTLDPGGIEVLTAALPEMVAVLKKERHTLKRSLTDPRLFAGIGNTYSDEILHAARLSPMRMSDSLKPEEEERLYLAMRRVLTEWTDRLRKETGAAFPEKVTAFHEGMAVHGRHGQLCPDCGQKVQRIVYAESETNYCPTCQNEGRLLADRALSRLLKEDWPKTLVELEELKAERRR